MFGKKDTTQQVVEMNLAFGNKRGNFDDFDFNVARAELNNMRDELNELEAAIEELNIEEVRDALCDVQVFAIGAQHKLGLNPQQDMQSVINGVLTRFVKDKEDLEETIEMHARKGVTAVEISGEYPHVVVRSAYDQPDAPRGKFLKSASYSRTVFETPKFPVKVFVQKFLLDLLDKLEEKLSYFYKKKKV